MTHVTLAQAYLVKAQKRLGCLDLLYEQRDWSDVVCEAQKVVELALKGMLWQVGIEPPRHPDVGGLLLAYAERFPPHVQESLPELARHSKWLRKEYEFALYGDAHYIPTEEYAEEDASRGLEAAVLAVRTAKAVIPHPEAPTSAPLRPDAGER